MALIGLFKKDEKDNYVGADVENAYFFIKQKEKGNIKYDYPNNTLIASFTVKASEASRQAEKDCDETHTYVVLGKLEVELPIPNRVVVDLKSKSAVTTYIYEEVLKLDEYSKFTNA